MAQIPKCREGEYLSWKTREAEITSLHKSLIKPEDSPDTFFPDRGDDWSRSKEYQSSMCNLPLLC